MALLVVGDLLIGSLGALAATQGPNAATSSADAGTSWGVSTTSAQACDSSYASASVGSGTTSSALNLEGYGFSIPSGSTINGIQVDYYKYATTASKNTMEDATVQLLIGGVGSGSNLATTTAWPSANTDTVYGGTANLWGLAPTIAQVNASNFGVSVAATNVSGGGGKSSLTAYVDCAEITITYTGPSISYAQAAYQLYGNATSGYADGTSWTQESYGTGNTYNASFGGQAVSFNNELWYMGGQSGSSYPYTYYNSVYCSADGLSWSDTTCGTSSAGWGARYDFASVVYNGKMWVIGGQNSSTLGVNDAWCSADGTTWNDSASTGYPLCGTSSAPWVARYGTQVVVFNNKMYLLGGYDGTNYYNDVWSSSDGTNWTEVTTAGCSTACANSFPARYDFRAFAFGGKLYVVGGNAGGTVKNDVWSSSDGATWTQVTANGTGGNAPWAARETFTGQVYNGEMWVMGGWNGSSTYDADVWCSADGATWYDSTSGGGCGGTANAAWSSRMGLSSAVYDGTLWTLGGEDAVGTFQNDSYFATLPAMGDGSSLAAVDTAATSPGDGQPFRLRLDLTVNGSQLSQSSGGFSLQYAPLSGGSCASSSGYADVTDSTTVRYYRNTPGMNGQPITASYPADPASPAGYVGETYQQAGTTTFDNPTTIPAGDDGVWDFALTTYDAPASTSYCFKVVSTGTGAVSSYAYYPEITTPASTTNQASYRYFANQDSGPSGWTEQTSSLPWGSTFGGQSVSFNGKLWYLGGYSSNASTAMSSVYCSTDNGVTWSDTSCGTTAAPWTAREDFSALVYNNEMWVIGGYDPTGGTVFNDVWASSDGTNWTEQTGTTGCSNTCVSSFTPRYWLGAVVYNNEMWVIGGLDASSNDLNDVYSSTDGSNWTNVLANNASPGSNQFAQRDSLTVLAYNNKIWVIDGDNYLNVTYLNDVWSSSDGITWTQALANCASSCTNQFTQREGTAGFTYDNKMWIMGGYDGNIQYNDVYSSTDGITWTTVSGNTSSPSMWIARTSMGNTVYNNQMYVIGGELSTNYASDAWSYSLGSVDVSTALADQNTPVDLFGTQTSAPAPVTAVPTNQPFRLRWILNIGGSAELQNSLSLKLQYAEISGSSCSSTETSGSWADVAATTPVQYYTGNTNAVNGTSLTVDANDPTDGSNIINYQDYVTQNPFSNTISDIPGGQDGLWDFALKMEAAPPHTIYCLRVLNNSGTAINGYSTMAQVDLAPTMPQLMRGREWWNSSEVRQFKDIR